MPGESRKRKCLFVSHISEEAELAKLIRQEMEEDFIEHVKFFASSDIGSINAGQNWLTAIQQALNKSAAVLILCSKASIQRPWVQFELGAAWMKGKRIIPICHSGMTVADLPMPLAPLEGVQLGTDTGVKRLYESVSEVLGWPKAPQPKNLSRFLAQVSEVERHAQHPMQQFEKHIDIVIPYPGTLDAGVIPDSAKIESNDVSMQIFGLLGSKGWTWSDIRNAAHKNADTRWLKQLQHCIDKAGRNIIFRPVQAIFHSESRVSYQPQLARKENLPDGSCRYHVHFVETTVAPLMDVQNDIGVLATLLRLGLRFRYEVIEPYRADVREFKVRKFSPQNEDLQRILARLRIAIEVIENDARSRGAQHFAPDAAVNVFEREDEQHRMIAMQSSWEETRALVFREEPSLTFAEMDNGMTQMRDMNYQFMCLATKRYHEMVTTRLAAQPRALRSLDDPIVSHAQATL